MEETQKKTRTRAPAKAATEPAKASTKAATEPAKVAAAPAKAVKLAEQADPAKAPSKATEVAEQAETPTNPIDSVVEKYKEAQWEIIRGGGIVDLIARRVEEKITKSGKKSAKTRFHYIRVLTKETENDVINRGEGAKNFVQNAFSNAAEPIFAMVTTTRTKADANSPQKWIQKIKVVFRDVNRDALIHL